MELSLSLNNLKFANVTDFSRSFGVKKQSYQNGGSLTTKEFNDAIALPYDIQRPVIITENTTVSDVEHDARLLINANGITLSLANGTEGIQLEITSNYAFTLSLAPAAFTALPVGVYVLAYKNSAWSIISRDINYIESQIREVGMPVGSVTAFYGNTAPTDWFFCDGTDTTGTANELQTNFPRLYAVLGNSNVLPDLRECVIVGAGKNETNIFDSTETNPVTGTAGTQAHDVYAVGEFKDDQFQGHQHEQYQATSSSKANWNSSYNISGWTWRDTRNIKNMENMTAARWGTTTHGKQFGLNYIIKAR